MSREKITEDPYFSHPRTAITPERLEELFNGTIQEKLTSEIDLKVNLEHERTAITPERLEELFREASLAPLNLSDVVTRVAFTEIPINSYHPDTSLSDTTVNEARKKQKLIDE